METSIGIIINALTLGCTYALIGLGFVVIFRATQVISFAQGVFMMIGALVFASLARSHWPTPIALIASMAFLALLAALTYRLVFGRLVGLEPFVVSIATVGLGTMFQAIGLMIWGAGTIEKPRLFGTGIHHLYGSTGISSVGIFTVVVTAAVFVIVAAGLWFTPLGLRMRAVADNAALAAYNGLNVTRLSSGAWAIGGATAALAGIVYLIGAQPDPGSVYSLGLLAFPAILLGGFDSIAGCVVGGLLIALIQTLAVKYIGGEYQDVVGYVVLLVLLSCRPQGIFGRVNARRL